MAKLTKAQRGRLEKLAAYLEGLPEDYAHFDMLFYCQRGDEAGYARKNGGFHECGSAACAIGHGPAAGILVPPRFVKGKDVDWAGYGRLFAPPGTDDYMWDWCFESPWSWVDDHHWGAAARIRYLLDHGSAPAGYWIANEKWPDVYASYRIDARDSGSDPQGEAGTAECEASQSGPNADSGIAQPGPVL